VVLPAKLLKQGESRLFMWRLCSWFVTDGGDPRSFNTEPSFLADAAKQAYENLLKEGKLVWGSLVQANTAIFEPGADNLPATYIYSTEEYFKSNPSHLLEIANRIFNLKGKKSGDALLDATAELVTDERKDSCSHPIPYRLTDGHEVYICSVYLFRCFLPAGRLTSRTQPLLVNPPHNGLALPLPLKFWSKQLITEMTNPSGQQSDQTLWKTIWQTEESPPAFFPVFGGNVEPVVDWIVDTPPIMVSENAYQLFESYILEQGPLEAAAVVVDQIEGEFSIGIQNRTDCEPYSKMLIREIMFCFPSGRFSEKEGVSIDYTLGPFQKGFLFKDATA